MKTEITPELFESETMQYLNELYRTAARLTRSRIDAEDLIQETYLQAWKSFGRFEIGTNCRAWLYKIMFNKFDHYRRKKFTQTKYMQEADEFVFDNASYAEPVPQHLTDAEMIRALDKLPEHYRSVVLLADVQDFDYREIAEILDVPIGTVMSRLNRARTRLRKTLAAKAGEYGIKNVRNQDYAYA